MTSKQRLVIFLVSAALVLTCLFPPWLYTFQTRGVSQVQTPAGYRFLLSPPPPKQPDILFGVSIDISRFILGIVAIVVLGGAAFAGVSPRKNTPNDLSSGA